MARRLAFGVAVLAILIGAAGWYLTRTDPLSAAQLPAHEPDLANGERVFYAGGCASCHAAEGATGDELLKLGGGRQLPTDFGTFMVPNISPDRDTGIGTWTPAAFVNAVMRGIGPDDEHLYPALPYWSYARMRIEDVLDLKAFLDTLPAVSNEAGENRLRFPYDIRRGIGLWKRLYLTSEPVVPVPETEKQALRGRYLVEGPGHCGECHTPRDAFGAPDISRWLAGAPNPEGKGTIPNITPGGLEWSADEIVTALQSGMTPEYDSLSGSMAAVVHELGHLPREDVAAMAAYLKAIPAVAGQEPAEPDG